MSILAETSVATIPDGRWNIDPAWSSLEFEVKKLGLITVKGRVPDFSGTVVGGAAPSIAGVAGVASITTFDATRDAHLQSPDFFDAERHPELRFTSTHIETLGDDLLVDGELTVKGITKAVQLAGRYVGTGLDPMGNDRIGIELAGTVDRTEFGLSWNLPLPGGGLLLPNEAVLRATIAAVRTE
jgi:polyisoprenoid-binding protein YceI